MPKKSKVLSKFGDFHSICVVQVGGLVLHMSVTRRQKAAAVAASNLKRHQKTASTEYD